MGHAYAEEDGKPQRVTPGSVSLGLAVDVERKDGTRSLVVPVLRDASELSFADFVARYDELVVGARDNTLQPDAYQGANITLTNPGGIGTVASVPRLMPGQGTIVATGAIGYPPGLTSVDPARLAELGVQKVMTMTSTYDHRVIQGAESGAFLRRIDQLLQGEDGFYESVFEAVGVTPRAEGPPTPRTVTAAEPVPAAATPAAAPGGGRGAAPGGPGGHVAGEGAAHARPSRRASRPARIRAGRRPRARAGHRRPQRRADAPHPGVGPARGRARRDLRRRAARSCARPTPARSPTRSSTSRTTSSASGCARTSSRARTASRSSRTPGGGCSSACPRSRRSRTTCTRPSSARSSSRSRGSTRSCRCSTRRSSSAPARARARSCSAWLTADG